MHIRLQAAFVSIAFLALFISIWAGLTTVKDAEVSATRLSPEQVSEVVTDALPEQDVRKLAAEGLTHAQIAQISGLELSMGDIEAAGGLAAFGFTTGGAAEEASETSGFPSPSLVWKESWEQLRDPFYDKGPNDKGIGIQLKYSLLRVGIGFLLAVVVAIPVGFLIGMSRIVSLALAPYIQILKPISPLAWLPVALYVIKDSEKASIFVIFVCSIWPMLINTAFAVANVKKAYLNIGRTLELNKFQEAYRIILPAIAPTIFTGMRISIGIAWLVIVAAEMVIGGIGVGYFVWNEWNGLNLASMLFAIVVIGVVGLVLDYLISLLVQRFSYNE